MRPLTISFPDHSRALLQQEISRHQDARYDHRLHCVLLVASGMSCEKVAALFGDSPRTLVNWARRFDGRGLAGLAEGNHSGRPTRLSAEQLEEVRSLVRQPPKDAEIDANLWDGKTLRVCLRKRYQVQMSVRQCQRLFAWLTPVIVCAARSSPRPILSAKPSIKNSKRGRTTQP